MGAIGDTTAVVALAAASVVIQYTYLPGGDHVALRRQYRGHNDKGEHDAWGLHARLDVRTSGRPTSLIILNGEPHLREP